jgi:hypothetical protein
MHMSSAIRQARLRPEFASIYPGLPAGEWTSARLLADRVLARVVDGEPPPDESLRQRVLPPEHFEFRDQPA